MTVSAHTDVAIDGSDNLPDRLNRSGFAASLAKALLLPSSSESFVASIEGGFGYGKTSVIRLVCRYYESLGEAQKPIIFHFNPWMLSDGGNLVQEFLLQLAAKLSTPDPGAELNKAAEQLIKYSSIFSAAKWLPGAEPWASIVKSVFDSVGQLAGDLGKLHELRLTERRQKVIEALQALDRPVVVFIDDLDRLPPDDVFAIIRLVKVVSDFPRVAYLLAFDYEHVVAALRSCRIPQPSRFLEKIIQWRRPLPRIAPNDLLGLINEELQKLQRTELEKRFGKKDDERLQSIYFEAAKPLLRNPRDIKRLFNCLRFSLAATQGNVALSDLFTLEVLAVKAPSIHDHILRVPEAYIGRSTSEIFSSEEWAKEVLKFKPDRERLLESLPAVDRGYVELLLEWLFPRLSTTKVLIGNVTGQDIDPKRSDGLIACHDVLSIYLSAGIPVGFIPIEVVEGFVQRPEERFDCVQRLARKEQILEFMDLLQEILPRLEVLDPADFFLRLAEIDNKAEAAGRLGDGFISPEMTTYLQVVIGMVLAKIEYSPRIKLIDAIVGSRRLITISQLIIYKALVERGTIGRYKAIPESERMIIDSDFERLKAQWIQTASDYFAEQESWGANCRRRAFWLLRSLNIATAQRIVDHKITTDDGFDNLLRTMFFHGRSGQMGDFIQIEVEDLKDFGGLERFRHRVATRRSSGIPFDTEIDATMKCIETGKAFYIRDGSEAPRV